MSEIETRTGDYNHDGAEYLIWETSDKAGTLYVHPTSGLIMNIEVDAARRGEGIARSLYEAACEVMDIYHVPSWGRTVEGDAFAEAVGGEVMDDEDACQVLGVDLEMVTGLAYAA